MKNMYLHIKRHFFSYVLILFIVVMGVTSYIRFLVYHDYVVEYEGVCDPDVQNCFVGHEENDSNQEYYFTKVIKYAPDLYKECGNNITNCEKANTCLPNEKSCFIVFCEEEDGTDICSHPRLIKDSKLSI